MVKVILKLGSYVGAIVYADCSFRVEYSIEWSITATYLCDQRSLVAMVASISAGAEICCNQGCRAVCETERLGIMGEVV